MQNLINAADTALRTLWAPHLSSTRFDAPGESPLDAPQKRHAAALMRVNHVGEVCAQALYTGQALATRNPELRQHLTRACEEETEHLAWTEQRLRDLGDRTSRLNPFWYAGAFALGFAAGRVSDAVSLGFVVETEKQVGEHLQNHLDSASGLPAQDKTSRAMVSRMREDELRHAEQALAQGAQELPTPVKHLMRAAAKVMTTVAYRI